MVKLRILRSDGRAQRYNVSRRRLADYDYYPMPGRRGGFAKAYVKNPKLPAEVRSYTAASADPIVEVRIVVSGDYVSTRPGRNWKQEREFTAVLHESEIPRLKRTVADYLRGTGFPLQPEEGDPEDVYAARDALVFGEVGPRRPSSRMPGIYDMVVRMKGKLQLQASQTMQAAIEAAPIFDGVPRHESEVVSRIRRAVPFGRGWRDPVSGKFTHDPAVLE